jgi:protein N-terminal methyltransferase
MSTNHLLDPTDPTPSSQEDAPEPSASLSISHADALTYWSNVTPTVDGMLGGYPQISRIDLRGSRSFLTKLRRKSALHPTSKPVSRVADCGAGIGRITLGFLVDVAATVDIVEPVQKFCDEFEARDEVRLLRSEAEKDGRERSEGRIGKVYTVGLEEWEPEYKYAVIWNQWCLSQLTDTELVAYLKRVKAYVEEGGWIVVKENTTREEGIGDVFDQVDSSVTRTDGKMRELFKRAGVKIVATEEQKGFPKSLYPVRSYALQSIEESG